MLPRMVFGQPESQVQVVTIEEYAMVYSDVACKMLDEDLDAVRASLLADALVTTVGWDEDSGPPWDL